MARPGKDVLNDILRSMTIKGSVYFCDSVQAPWTKTFAALDSASFHMVRQGGCNLTINGEMHVLGSGDLAFIEPGCRHVLRSRPADEKLRSHTTHTVLLCGYCRFDDEPIHPLIRALPSLVVLRDHDLRQLNWLRSTLDQLSREYVWRAVSQDVVVDKLTEIMVVELLQHVCDRGERRGFVNALYDRAISRALSCLHADPRRPWTLADIATRVALSRAALAKRFKQQVGSTLIDYLTQLRMHRARELLRGTDLSIQSVAAHIGYESDLSFSKAFKRVVGLTPSGYRKRWSHTGDSIDLFQLNRG